MHNDFEVIDDIDEIERLNKLLATRLQNSLPFVESREIAYPSGRQIGEVRFEAGDGTNLRGWSAHEEDNKLVNFLLYGSPRHIDWLQITVQLNFPRGEYNRRLGGAFVRDSDERIFIAHRGRLTKGNAALRKQRVLEEFAESVIDAVDGGNTSRLILIAELDDPTLEDKLWEFADEAREVATKLGLERIGISEVDDEDDDDTDTDTGADQPASPADAMGILANYTDEFFGETVSQPHGDGRRVVTHGAVVKALEAQMRKLGQTKKSRAIDLAVLTSTQTSLFEVKTSVSTTDIYTATGQLLIHGSALESRLARKVVRYLVVPEQPSAALAAPITAKGFIRIVTYAETAGGYEFEGL